MIGDPLGSESIDFLPRDRVRGSKAELEIAGFANVDQRFALPDFFELFAGSLHEELDAGDEAELPGETEKSRSALLLLS